MLFRGFLADDPGPHRLRMRRGVLKQHPSGLVGGEPRSGVTRNDPELCTGL